MSGIFGRSQQPSGTADALIGTTQTTPPGQQGGDPGQQQGDPNQGVPPFEGATSGNVTESQPAQGNEQPGDQDPNQNQNQQQGDPNQNQQQSDPNQQQQTVQFDPATAYAIQVANEAKVAAEVARQLAEKETAPSEEEIFEELSYDDEFDPEELVSDGEKKLAKKLIDGLNTTRRELHDTRKQLKVAENKVKAAEDNAQNTNLEFEIQRAMTHYGVTRAELETAYQRSNGKVEDLNILAESALYARLAQKQQQQNQQQLQSQVQQATQERGQETKVVGQQQSNSGNQGTQSNQDGPRGGGKLNPFDGASIAQHYSAFA